VLAGAVDDRGYRLISREAFPLAFLSNITSVNWNLGASWMAGDGFRMSERLTLRVLGFDPANWLD